MYMLHISLTSYTTHCKICFKLEYYHTATKETLFSPFSAEPKSAVIVVHYCVMVYVSPESHLNSKCMYNTKRSE
jgi:hypothetical protein